MKWRSPRIAQRSRAATRLSRDAGNRGLAGRRCGSAPRVDHQSRPRAREIELTSYAELALARQPDDVAHPAFAKLFVETEFVPELGAILATRRRRSSGDPLVWAAHLAVVEGESPRTCSSRPIVRVFSGAGKPSARRPPLPKAGRCPIPSAPCSTRSSACAGVCGSRAAPRRASRSGRWPPRRAKRCSIWPTSITTRWRSSGRPRSPGPRRRCSYIIWASARTRRIFSNASPIISSIRTRHCARRQRSSSAARQGVDALGAGHFRRSAHRAGARRGRRTSRTRPSAFARPRILAFEAAGRRSGDPQRTRRILCPGLAEFARSARAHEPVDAADSGDDPRGAVFVLRADLVPPEIRGLLHACARAVLYGDRGSLADQINRARDLNPAGAPSTQPPRRPRRPKRRCRDPRWSSSTVSAGSRMTAANM